jgi:hypothetical protein
MDKSHSQLKLEFEIVTGTQAVTSKGSSEFAVDFKRRLAISVREVHSVEYKIDLLAIYTNIYS